MPDLSCPVCSSPLLGAAPSDPIPYLFLLVQVHLEKCAAARSLTADELRSEAWKAVTLFRGGT